CLCSRAIGYYQKASEFRSKLFNDLSRFERPPHQLSGGVGPRGDIVIFSPITEPAAAGEDVIQEIPRIPNLIREVMGCVFVAAILFDIDVAKTFEVSVETAFFHNPRRGFWLPRGSHRLHPRQSYAIQHLFNFVRVKE